MPHCELIQAGDLQGIVGDTDRNGVGGQQYCGLWSLTSKHRSFNAFGNSYAGLLPGEIRGRSPTLESVNPTTAALVRAADDARPVDVRAVYAFQAPHYVDHTLTFTDRRSLLTDAFPFREVSWCCYMNCPDDPRLHFLSHGEWLRYISPTHGVGSNVAPAYVPDHALEPLRPQVMQNGYLTPFHTDRIARRFDQPFYYGRVGEMVLILIFDQPRWLRFYCSPSGGGRSLLPDRSCPAWDFEWLVPAAAYALHTPITLRLRLVYKLYVSDDDVLEEVRRAQSELKFETV